MHSNIKKAAKSSKDTDIQSGHSFQWIINCTEKTEKGIEVGEPVMILVYYCPVLFCLPGLKMFLLEHCEKQGRASYKNPGFL